LAAGVAGCFSAGAWPQPYGNVYDYTYGEQQYVGDPFWYGFPDGGYYPYYPYVAYGDGDHDCDEGFCGPRGHRGWETSATSRAEAIRAPLASAERGSFSMHGSESGGGHGGGRR